MSKFTLPAHWASYIINGDHSGLADSEKSEVDAWFAENDEPNIVDVSEETFFSWHNDAFTTKGCTCAEYTALD